MLSSCRITFGAKSSSKRIEGMTTETVLNKLI